MISKLELQVAASCKFFNHSLTFCLCSFLSIVHMRGMYQGVAFEEKDVGFILGEGKLFCSLIICVYFIKISVTFLIFLIL